MIRNKDHTLAHEHCPVFLSWRWQRNGHWHCGLYCQTHEKWLKWVTREHAEILINEMQVPVRRAPAPRLLDAPRSKL